MGSKDENANKDNLLPADGGFDEVIDELGALMSDDMGYVDAGNEVDDKAPKLSTTLENDKLLNDASVLAGAGEIIKASDEPNMIPKAELSAPDDGMLLNENLLEDSPPKPIKTTATAQNSAPVEAPVSEIALSKKTPAAASSAVSNKPKDGKELPLLEVQALSVILGKSDKTALALIDKAAEEGKAYTRHLINLESDQDVRLCDVDLTIARGEILALVGSENSGKRELLKAIDGAIDLARGKILLTCGGSYKPLDITAMRSNSAGRQTVRRKNISFMGEDAPLLEWLSVGENIALALEFAGVAEREHVELVTFALHQMSMKNRVGGAIEDLTPLEYEKVKLARAIAKPCDLLVLDNSFAKFDLKEQIDVFERLKKWQNATGVSILITANQHSAVKTIADRVLSIEDGRVSSFVAEETQNLALDVAKIETSAVQPKKPALKIDTAQPVKNSEPNKPTSIDSSKESAKDAAADVNANRVVSSAKDAVPIDASKLQKTSEAQTLDRLSAKDIMEPRQLEIESNPIRFGKTPLQLGRFGIVRPDLKLKDITKVSLETGLPVLVEDEAGTQIIGVIERDTILAALVKESS